MAKPHPALIDIAAGRPVGFITDPTTLLPSAAEHRMSGLLWSRVRSGEIELPFDDALVLATRDVTVRNRHRQLEETLGEVIDQLDERGIAVAALKGVTAEHRWYDRVGERPCIDVDLLLAPDDRSRIEEVVDALCPSYPGRVGLGHRVDTGRQQGATLNVGDVAVDLHIEVPKLGVPSRATELIWSRTVPYALPAGGTVRVLDPEAQLYSFLTHVIKDRLSTLLGFVDIVRLVQREELDWEVVRTLARVEGLELPLRLTLAAVFTHLGLPIPANGLGTTRRAAPVWRTLCRASVVLDGPPQRGQRPRRLLLMPLVIRGRRVEVVRWLLRRARSRFGRRTLRRG
jgi:hypothetical protein